ncbi:hypothetical protein PHYPSEUDO_004914 [Phytophthora pseudosyringae]|uniref:WRKY transcription factor 19 n=1 Tax=Phytophthora pseudosyringae TaxID=221518 RepID=A0A8T1WI87_9STRA|nr:hypothetical protein PHYPSEUDO_004914 [Phytophthora pseudosyringae]
MVDVKSVGSNLTPAQRDETMADLAFFLDEFGSTHAVRIKLREQESDVRRLRKRVRRLLGNVNDANAPREEEEKDTNDDVNATESTEEGVDDIMTDLHFFLQTFGSTRAVRAKLKHQREEIVGLECTAQWFQERQRTSSSSDARQDEAGTEADGDIVDHGSAGGVAAEASQAEPSKHKDQLMNEAVSMADKDFVSSGAVNAYLQALKTVNEVCTQLKRSNASTWSISDNSNSSDQAEMLAEDSIKHFEQTKETRSTHSGVESVDKLKHSCSQPGCSKRVQVKGLCHHHGGYYICVGKGCNRRAITKNLCRHHGGGTKCRYPECGKLVVSSGKGFCAVHAREKGITLHHACKMERCNKLQVKQGYCNMHSFQKFVGRVDSNNGISVHDQQPSDRSESNWKPHHRTCRAAGCMRWVMRNGDPNEYCFKHGDDPAPKSSTPGNMSATVSPFVHLAGADKQMQTVVVFEDSGAVCRKRALCKQTGCENLGKNYGAKKGFCFRHGGGFTCIVEGCAKSQQRNRLCAAHGGYYECKAEGCKKDAYPRGYCYTHSHKPATSDG